MSQSRRLLAEVWAIEEYRRTGHTNGLGPIVAAALARAGFDLRTEPSLEETKRLLIDVIRQAEGGETDHSPPSEQMTFRDGDGRTAQPIIPTR